MNLKKNDLIIFSFLAVLFEFLSSYFFDILQSGFILSFSLLIYLIMSIRWGMIGIIPYVLSSIPLIFLDKNLEIYEGILYYGVANIFALIPIMIYSLVFKHKSRNEIIKSPLYMILYCLATFLSVAIGKGLILLILYQDLSGILKYLVSMIFTYVLTLIVFYSLTKLNNSIVMDMDLYKDDGKEV